MNVATAKTELRERREALRLRQSDIAQRVGCSQVLISCLERGLFPNSKLAPRVWQILLEAESRTP